MTDQASICNVLLEATEYLSKLGSNLKTRTDSLKEKRINKSKLKNTHSVHKAADKILVICELSKKSIENVENGVKNILNFCAANTKGRKEDHGLTKETSSKEQYQSNFHADRYQTFTFESKKLTISRNVPVKHYMSCKVFVKNMPKSMQDKYPVYYNCKLYRLRNKNEVTNYEDLCNSNNFSDQINKFESFNTDKIISTEKSLISHNTASNTVSTLSDEKVHEITESLDNSGKLELGIKKPLYDKSETKIMSEHSSSESVGDVNNRSLYHRSSTKIMSKDTSSENVGDVNNQSLNHQSSANIMSKDTSSESVGDVKNQSLNHQSSANITSKDVSSEIVSDVNNQPLSHQSSIYVAQKGTIHDEPTKDFLLGEKQDVTNTPTDKISYETSETLEEKAKKKSETEKQSNKISEERGDLQKDTAKNSKSANELINKSNQTRKRFKKIRTFEDTSSSDDIFVPSNEIKNKLSHNVNEVIEQVHRNSETKHGMENMKSSDMDMLKDSNENKNIPSITSVTDEKENKENTQTGIEILSNNEPTQGAIQNTDTTHNSNESKKPLLRCVDIKKLLKPEVDRSIVKPSISVEYDNKRVQKITNKPVKQYVPKHAIRMNAVPLKISAHNLSPLEEVTNKDESKGNTCILMKKKVKAFKPKKFYINVTRLPKITEKFLRAHKLKKIIQKGTTVLEIDFARSDCETEENRNKECDGEIGNTCDSSATVVTDVICDPKRKNESRRMSLDVTKVKNALLDSDSDKCESATLSPNKEKNLAHSEIPNDSLHSECDFDKEKMEKSKSSVHTHGEDTCNDTDNLKIPENFSTIDANVSKEVSTNLMDNSNNIVSKRPNNSDDNAKADDEVDVALSKGSFQENTTPKKKRRRESSGSTPQSKRKRIMESMKAKRMLLTYSSSSDTDDEQLRNALKDIKECLLKGISSDEDVRKESAQCMNVMNQNLRSNNSYNAEELRKGNQEETVNNICLDIEMNSSDREESEKTTDRNFDIDNQQVNSCLNGNSCRPLIEQNDEKKGSEGSGFDHLNKMPAEETATESGNENTKMYEGDVSNVSLSIKEAENKDRGMSTSDKQKDISDEVHSINLPKKTSKARTELLKSSSDDSSSDDLINRKNEISETCGSGKEKTSSDERTINDEKKMRKELLESLSDESSDVLVNNYKKNDCKNSDTLNKKKDSSKESSENERKDTSSKASSISQIDGNMDESGSDSCKMGRSKMKASGSNGQSSDSRDALDKDIDGLTNLKSLNKSRKHRESKTNSNTDAEKNNKNKAKSGVPTLDTELLELKSDSSAEGSESEAVDSEEILEIPNINGGSVIDNLAKGDLLQDSDSSNSGHTDKEDKRADNVKEEEDSDAESDENNVKSRRRKAHAISSDSEGGPRKKADARVSDFEDSEAESSEPAKNKRKKKATDSDASAGASSSDDVGKKKRRRIKQVKDSDASGSESETEGKKHGRKNIRRVMGKDQLEEATKKAAREEKERIARIAERQKLYNNLDFDESGKPDEVVLEKVILDFDPETKEPLIEVDRGLVKKLKPHQANGIKFMWDTCFESVKRIKKDKGSGCILAHCMGLGKTLQVVSLTHTLLTHSKLTGVQRVLVVCPLSTVLNWVNEFRIWLKHAESEFEVDVYEISKYKQNSERAYRLQDWFENGGVCVLGYEMFRNLSADNKKFRKKMLRSFQESLVDPGPDLVVCDEGHLLKNEKTRLSQSMNRVKTLRRIVLTGTPLQNNLKEYYCMVQFVKPNLLGKYNEYLNRFVNPITNGQYTDSTEHDIRVMKRRSHVLHKMLDGAVQRRDYGVLAPFLPPKHEYVLFITLTEIQTKLYQHYLDNYSRKPQPGKSSGFLFPDFQSLQRIWTHPLVLKYNSERYEIMQQKKREKEEEDSEGSLADFIDDDDTTPDETSTEESSEELSDMSDDSRKKSKKKKSPKKSNSRSTRRGTRANPVETQEEEPAEVVEIKDENPTEWWIKLVSDDELEDMRHSHKLVLLFDILRQCEAIGDKLLVFSQSLYSLDLIEHFLAKVDEATQDGRIDEKLCGHIGSWSPGIDYFRLDGSTSCENRSIWCKSFNREDNPRARLFLISTRAGGLGINLVAANRVVIFDVSWNPSHDVQSIFRVYRFGQKKPCYIYRFLALGTMEEKIYERQVTKQAISKRVIDEQQIDRHYAENDLAELYKFEPLPIESRPIPALPKDRLFAEMLKEHEQQIYKYHEHDSLLENKEEETLTEEERKAAWEDFENEKNRPPPAPFGAPWPMHNGMAQGIMAQQQQQLAYAALATVLRKNYPNMPEQDIAGMATNILYANPQLMQKMYAQTGMMNPAMAMNPMMNTAGMGGTSGLQYEPPWQRQQRQQQQMRLQQLMQQQNSGAKYYAGGLGSRDPVLMAIQQQQAREMLLGEARGVPGAVALDAARGRPRGRPPMLPHMAPAPSGAPDVVQLDSD